MKIKELKKHKKQVLRWIEEYRISILNCKQCRVCGGTSYRRYYPIFDRKNLTYFLRNHRKDVVCTFCHTPVRVMFDYPRKLYEHFNLIDNLIKRTRKANKFLLKACIMGVMAIIILAGIVYLCIR